MSDQVIIAAVGQYSDGETVRTIGVSSAAYHDPALAADLEGGTFLPVIDGDGGIQWSEEVSFQPQGGTTALQVSGLRLINTEGEFDAWAAYSVAGLDWTVKRGRPDQTWEEFELIFRAVGDGTPTFQGRSTMSLRLRDRFAAFGQPASQVVFDTDTPNERLVNQLVPYVYGDVLQVEGPLFDPVFFRIFLAQNLAVIRRIHEGGTPTDNWIDVPFGAQVTRSVPDEAYPITADIGGPSLPAAELENLLEAIGGFESWTGGDPDGFTVTETPPDSEISEDVTNGGALIVSTLGSSTGGDDLNAGTAVRGTPSTGRTLTAKDAADATVTDVSEWPALIDADDAARVIATVGGAGLTSPRLTLTNFGGALGASATLSGITVSVRAQKTGAGTGSITFSEVRLTLPNGSVSEDKSASTAVTGTKTLHTFGGANDAWGLVLTPDLVNDEGFGVRLSFQTGTSGSYPVAAEIFEVILTAHTSAGNQTLKLYVDVSAVTGDRYRPRITYDDLGASPSDTISARWAFVDAIGDPVPILTRTPGSTGAIGAESLNLSDPNVITEGVLEGAGVLEGELIADGPVFAVEFFAAPEQTGEQRLVRIDLDELSISINRFQDLIRTLAENAGFDPDEDIDNDSLAAIATATGDPVLGWYVRGNATFDQVATIFAHSLASAVFPGLDGKLHAAMLSAPARPASGQFLEVIRGDRDMGPAQSEADPGDDLRDRVHAAQNVDPLRPNETAGVTETWPESERQKVLSDWRITERVDWEKITEEGADWPIAAVTPPPAPTYPTSGDSVDAVARALALLDATTPTSAADSLTINGEDVHGYDVCIVEGPSTVSAFTEADWFTATEDSRSAWVVVKGDLTIDAAQVFKPAARKLFTVLFVDGDLTVNGEISMTARGANHGANGSNLAAATIRIATDTIDSVVNPEVPAAGAAGAPRKIGTGANGNGVAGSAGTAGQTGGGGSGGLRSDSAGHESGGGSDGTAFSGGTGGGSSNRDSAEDGAASGGKGGDGATSFPANTTRSAGAGAGNPGGTGAGVDGANGDDGTGGTIIVLCTGAITGSGSITSDGSDGGDSSGGGGGASGGGSVNVLGNTITGITTSASGGVGGSAIQSGGAGGAGTDRTLTGYGP